MKSDRKFYKCTIQVEILCEEPFEWDDLYGVHLAITDGDCSGKAEQISSEVLTAEQAAQELITQGSDPGFFQLTETGEDAE